MRSSLSLCPGPSSVFTHRGGPLLDAPILHPHLAILRVIEAAEIVVFIAAIPVGSNVDAVDIADQVRRGLDQTPRP